MELSVEIDALNRGRAYFARQAWRDAHALLTAADRERPLDPEDLERLSTAAFLIGQTTESLATLARAHHAYLQQGDPDRAIRCAAWVAFWLLLDGDSAHAGGWIARARRLIDQDAPESVARGWLLLPEGLQRVSDRDGMGAWQAFARAVEIGTRLGDAELTTFARNGQGRALVRAGRASEGMALLDEIMVTVASGVLPPITSGAIYCSVLEACDETFDIRRAREWTAALKLWCASQPDVLPFRGECLVRRAENLQVCGTLSEALDEALRACECLAGPPVHRAAGTAFYQRGELHRLRGEFTLAETAYRDATHAGREPQPGFALLRLAQGHVDAAKASIATAMLRQGLDIRPQSEALAACVEIALAADDVLMARNATAELLSLTERLPAPFLLAMAAQAEGHVLLADGQPQAALRLLRDAWLLWGELPAPYHAARARVLIASALRQLGDEDTAVMELDAARQGFVRVGATPDVARVDVLIRAGAEPTGHDGPLTAREHQVLVLVATGKTNRAIAHALTISEKTVARHVSNIFAKLALSTRAAAAAYAHRHHLV